MISVPANKRVKPTFDKFNLDREDNVRILDGQKSGSEEVAVYYGYNLFSRESAVYSTGGYMRIKFNPVRTLGIILDLKHVLRLWNRVSTL